MKQIWEVSKTDPSYEDVKKKLAPRLQKSSGLLALDPCVSVDAQMVH